jgi:hypothetical protein
VGSDCPQAALPATLIVFAYCRKGAGLKTRSASASIGGANPRLGTATAQCRRGERLISGGYSTPVEDASDTGPNLWYYSSHKTGNRSWTVSAYDDGGLGTFTARAYCEKQ